MENGMTTAKELYAWVTCWESYEDESFIDYFCDDRVNLQRFVLWLYHNKYMTIDKLNKFCEESFREEVAVRPSIYDLLDGSAEYSIFEFEDLVQTSDEKENLVEYKSLQLVAEYLSESEDAVNDVKDFIFNGDWWASFDDEEEKADYCSDIKRAVESWENGDEDDYDRVKSMTIDEINSMK